MFFHNTSGTLYFSSHLVFCFGNLPDRAPLTRSPGARPHDQGVEPHCQGPAQLKNEQGSAVNQNLQTCLSLDLVPSANMEGLGFGSYTATSH